MVGTSQLVYTETRPRGPISTDWRGPGPCYSLPGLMGQGSHDPRSSHTRGPAYSLGGRKKAPTKAPHEGPRYVLLDKTYVRGREEGPSFSMKGRYKEQGQAASESPGPAAYSPPARGPAADRAPPAYSLTGRPRDKLPGDDSPGPGAYHAGKSDLKSQPSFSMKGRHEVRRRGDDDLPGPSAYYPSASMLRRGRTTGPEVSMKGRHADRLAPQDDSPGPAAYSPAAASRADPAWSIGSRPRRRSLPEGSPGPAAYAVTPGVGAAAASAEGVSFGVRHKQKDAANDSPGPAAYLVGDRVHGAGREHVTLKGRHRGAERRGDDGPGPGAYSLDTAGEAGGRTGPAYSISSRHYPTADKENQEKPGPNAYLPEDAGATKRAAPSYSFAGGKPRAKIRHEGNDAPGPGSYRVTDPDVYRKAGPAFSLAGRHQPDESSPREGRPGPADYYPHMPAIREDMAVPLGVRHSLNKYEPHQRR